MKILFMDLENFILPEHIFHPGKQGRFGRPAGFCGDLAYVLVFGYMWLGEEPKAIHMTKKQMKDNPLTDDHILTMAKEIMDQADVIVTWYGKGHDVPFLNTRLARHGLFLDHATKHVDLYDAAKKKLRLSSNSLNNVAKYLGVEEKNTISKTLWPDVWAGKYDSLVSLAEYCKQDVRVTALVYEKMLGLGLPLPHIAKHAGKEHGCPSCGGDRLYGNGYRVTKTKRYRRLRCEDCGSHHKGEQVSS